MIVGSMFEGDDDTEVACIQHDVYGAALEIIVQTCNDQTAFARSLLRDANHAEWGKVFLGDHRTHQGGHDLLAAVWRSRHDFRQLELPFEHSKSFDKVGSLWLDWLRQEVAGWITAPYLVRSVQLILANQNEPRGYLAESQFCLDIIDRFSDVPWKRQWCEAYQADLLKC